MKESMDVAQSYVYSTYTPPQISQTDLYIHVPQGAISKDGPSAGVAIAVALYSVLHKRAVSAQVAMTGEIDLSGRIHAVGGIKEKCLAAYSNGISHIILPKSNEADLYHLPTDVTQTLQISFVSHIEEVITLCFN